VEAELRMKVLYDFQITQMQKRGGISRYLFEIATRLGGVHGVDVSMFRGLNQSEMEWIDHARILKEDCSRLISGRICRQKWVTVANYAGFAMFQRLRPRFDILHLSYYPRVIINTKSAALVVSVYDMIPERFPEIYKDNVIIARRKRAFEAADLILSISNASKLDLLSFYQIDESKIRVIPLASSFSDPYYHSDLLGETKENENVRPFLLYVGTRPGYKNFMNLLIAYAGDPNLRRDTDVVCFGADPLSEEEKGFIAHLGIEDRIRHANGPDSSLAWYYRHALALVCPSLYEGFGLPLVEAMTLGCPVVASNRGSIPEVVGDAGALFDPIDISAIQTALKAVVYDEGNRDRLRVAGRLRAREFSWEKAARQTYEAYRSVASNGMS
jgi:glycosyltransferase involved in cell wall biosynthesis